MKDGNGWCLFLTESKGGEWGEGRDEQCVIVVNGCDVIFLSWYVLGGKEGGR